MLFYVTLLLSSIIGYFVCQTIAAVSPNPPTAMAIYPMAVFFNLLFTGFFQYIPVMQYWLQPWMPVISFMRWGYQSLVVNEFVNNSKLSDVPYYLEILGFDGVSAGSCTAILLIFVAFYVSLLVIALVKVNFERR